MEDKYAVVFIKAGSGSDEDIQRVARGIANASKQPLEKILSRVMTAPFVYKRDLNREKADAIAAALKRLGAIVEIQQGDAVVAAASPEPKPREQAAPKPAARPPAEHAAPKPATPPAVTESGSFDFKAEPEAPPKPAFEPSFLGGPPEPQAMPAAESGGFVFKEETVSKQEPAGHGVIVERNIDYGSKQKDLQPEKAAAPKPAAKAAGDKITCPRCGTEQPFARECASCGVIIEKAGAAQEHAAKAKKPQGAAPTPAPARTGKKMNPIIIAVPAVIVLLVLCFVLGLFNPLIVKMRVGSDPVLSGYKAAVSAEPGGLLLVQPKDPTKAAALQTSLTESDKGLRETLGRLAGMSSVLEFDTARSSREFEQAVAQYTGQDAFKLREAALKVAGSLLKADKAGWSVGGQVFLTDQDADKLGRKADVAVLEPEALNALVNKYRTEVAGREEKLRRETWLATANTNFQDSFNRNALAERWTWAGARPEGFKLVKGEIQWTTDGRDLAGATRGAPIVGVDEPTKDYTVEVAVKTVKWEGPSRAGLLIYLDEENYLEFMLTRMQEKTVGVFGANLDGEYTQGISRPTGEPFRIRIRKQGAQYRWEMLSPGTGRWSGVDSFSPRMDAQKPRKLALTALGAAGSTYSFDNFQVSLSP